MEEGMVRVERRKEGRKEGRKDGWMTDDGSRC